MRRNQLGHAVKSGRKVTFNVFDADPITGYLAGWDETSWFVLEPIDDGGFSKRIVNKECNPVITLHDEPTFEGEDSYAEMERIVGPFRGIIMEEVFGHSRPATRKAAS